VGLRIAVPAGEPMRDTLQRDGRLEALRVRWLSSHRDVGQHGGEVRLRSAPGAGTVAEFTLDPPPGPAPSAAASAP